MPDVPLHEIIGHVDQERRPLVRLSFSNHEDSVLAHIDTGCTFAIIMERHKADSMSLEPSDVFQDAFVASGDLHRFEVRMCEIDWFGSRRKVNVYVPVPHRNGNTERFFRVERDGDPDITVGTHLLHDSILEIDFVRKFARVRQG